MGYECEEINLEPNSEFGLQFKFCKTSTFLQLLASKSLQILAHATTAQQTFYRTPPMGEDID